MCLGLTGCTTVFGKKSSGSANPASRAVTDRGTVRPADPVGLPAADRPVAPASAGGLLAGQVLDSYNRRPPATYIQVIDVQAGGSGGGPPIEVAADSQGYFTIQGLQPGRHYQL